MSRVQYGKLIAGDPLNETRRVYHFVSLREAISPRRCVDVTGIASEREKGEGARPYISGALLRGDAGAREHT